MKTQRCQSAWKHKYACQHENTNMPVSMKTQTMNNQLFPPAGFIQLFCQYLYIRSTFFCFQARLTDSSTSKQCISVGSRNSSVVRVPDLWLKGCRFESLQEQWKKFFSRVNFLCWLSFRYLFHPSVTTVARKRSWSFCQKCRWQVTAKHAYTLRMWLCMKWHGAWLYGVHRTCAKLAAVSCGTSHATVSCGISRATVSCGTSRATVSRGTSRATVSCGTSHARTVSTPLWWIFNKKRTVKLVIHVEPHASAVSLLKRAENSTM